MPGSCSAAASVASTLRADDPPADATSDAQSASAYSVQFKRLAQFVLVGGGFLFFLVSYGRHSLLPMVN